MNPGDPRFPPAQPPHRPGNPPGPGWNPPPPYPAVPAGYRAQAPQPAPQPTPQKKLSGMAKAVIMFVVTGLAGSALVSGIWADEILNRWSNRTPLDVHVSALPTRPTATFDLVVPGSADLSDRLGVRPEPGDDCDRLWQVGVESGGMPIGETGYSIVLHGNAREGVVITEIRAVMSRRLPAIDGALFYCPIQAGGTSALALSFGLSTDAAEPVTTDRATYSSESEGWVPRFDDGYVITIAKDEDVPLDVALTVHSYGSGRDGFAWHLEADAIVGGERRTIVIDNGGEDFIHPGSLAEYSRAYGGGAQLGGDWQSVVSSSELRELPPPR